MTCVYHVLLTAMLTLLAGCGADGYQTTEGVYSENELIELEKRASANDRTALRELDIFYGMEGRDRDRSRIHQRRFMLNDVEAIEEEIMLSISRSDKSTICAERSRYLEDARSMAIRRASIMNSSVENDPTYIITVRRIDLLEC